MVGHLYVARRFEAAVAEIHRLRGLFDRPSFAQGFFAASLWQLGRHEEALQEFEKLWSRDSALVRAVDRGYAEAGSRGGMRAAADYGASHWDSARDDAYDVAASYARIDAVDTALEWLERAYLQRKPQFLHVAADPAFDPLRPDPRFAALLRRIGLAP